MKYIRTEDGIFKLYDLKNGCFKLDGKNYCYDFMKEHEITHYKQADTIEELCDEFVFNVENQVHLVINNYKRALEIAKSYGEDKIKFICYGAIWTDKGLVYVAKMNEKGELELL